MVKYIGLMCLFGMLIVSSIGYSEVYQKRNADGSITFTDNPRGASKAKLAPVTISNAPLQADQSSENDKTQASIVQVPIAQYQSLVFAKPNVPLPNLYSNPNMGASVSAILTPRLNPEDQVDLLYNGKILVQATINTIKVDNEAPYSDNLHENSLINRSPPKVVFDVTNKGDSSYLTFKFHGLTRVNFPPGIHTWQMRVVGPDGKKIKIETDTSQFNVIYSEETKKPVVLIFSDKTFLVVRTVVHLVANALSPI